MKSTLPISVRYPDRAVRSYPFLLLSFSLSLALAACSTDLGPCDETLAKTVVYSDDAEGLPAYAGQALIDSSCGNGSFCHSAYATDYARYGVPLGLDFDMALATDAAQTDVLANGKLEVEEERYAIYREVETGHMPPGPIGAEVAGAGRSYAGLPALRSDEGLRILRNWLACGAPVVQSTTALPPGVKAVGDVVPAQSSSGCSTGLVSCSGACVDLQSDVLNCGACDSPCGGGTVCYAGGCLAGGCPAPTSDCGGSCVDTSSDINNCGSCGHPCTGGTTCSGGACACSGGTTLCGTDCVDLATSTSNCGFCGMPCPSGELCASGTCQAVSFANDIQPIFTQTCTGSICHSGARPAASLSLEAGKAYNELVNASSATIGCTGYVLVTPSSVPDSYLVNKLTGVGMCRGSQMPKVGTTLPTVELDRIRSWITAGAPNN